MLLLIIVIPEIIYGREFYIKRHALLNIYFPFMFVDVLQDTKDLCRFV
jgi:hypothetical protein